MKLLFELEKETKGALRYQQMRLVEGVCQPYEVSEGAEVGTIYIRKHALSSKPVLLYITI